MNWSAAWKSWAPMFVIFGSSSILLLPLLGTGFTFDQGVFSVLGDTLLRGGVPYRDAWEHKPPGVFYVYYLSFLLLEREIWAVRLVELLSIAFSSVFLFNLVLRRCGSRLAGVVSALLLPVAYLSFGQNTAQPESFQIPFILGAFLLWPDLEVRSASGLRCACAGFLLSGAVLFKTPAVLFCVLMLGEGLYRDWREEGWFAKLRLSLLTGGAMLLLPATLLIYYSMRGAAGSFLDAMVTYPAQYAAVGVRQPLSWHLHGCIAWVAWLAPGITLLLILGGAVRSFMVRRTETIRWAMFLVTGLATAVIQGRYFEYHYLPLVPGLCWGAGLIFSKNSNEGGATTGREIQWQRVVLVGGLMLAMVTFGQSLWEVHGCLETLGPLARFHQANNISDPKGGWAGQRLAARYVQELTKDDESLFIWGDQPLVYVQANRRMAGPNCHLMQIAPVWDGSERVQRLIARLSSDKPRLVMVTSDSLWWRDGRTAYELLRYYPEMQLFLDNYYRLVPGPEGYQLWLSKS